jgi:hypothetical protein
MGGLGFKLLGTNMDSFEANWVLELELALDPSLHLGSPNHELSFLRSFFFFGGLNWLNLAKMLPCRFSLDLPLIGLGPSSKGHGSNFLLWANRTALFYWTLDLRRMSKAALSVCGRHLTLGKTSASREDGTQHHTWKVSQNEENYI